MSDERDTSAGSAEWQSRHDRLDAFLTLTATSLSSLQFRELLLELLQRIREVLEVDTAALFVLDERSRELEAWAAIGIDEEALRSVGVPVGKGFTGRIAQLKQTLVLDKVDVSTVASPALVDRGCARCSGHPCSTKESWWVSSTSDPYRTGSWPGRSRAAGTGRRAPGRRRTGSHARGRARSRRTARAKPEAKRPPHVTGLSLAARYIPAERAVGGDWSDLFALPSGEVWSRPGDVAGHGLQGATVMGRTRSTMRAYALLGAPADEVLSAH